MSRRTVCRRISEMSINLYTQLKEKVEYFTHFSLALDESCDNTGTAQLLIFVRGIDRDFNIVEELAELRSMKSTTTGDDIFCEIVETMHNLKLQWKKLFSLTTEGAPCMTGLRNGVVGRITKHMQDSDINSLFLHCIIHQESLAAKILNWTCVLDIVTKCVNIIRSRGLNHRQFREFLETLDTEEEDVIYYSKVRWLSRGNVLLRFFKLRNEIRDFLFEKGLVFDEFSDPNWLWDLSILTDISHQLNVLNLELQGKDKLVSDMYTSIESYVLKLDIFSFQVQNNNFISFPCCDELKKELILINFQASVDKIVQVIYLLKDELNKRFTDFDSKSKEILLFQDPFSINTFDVAPVYQTELCDLQCNPVLKSSFQNNDIYFYRLLDNIKFANLKDLARSILSIFGSRASERIREAQATARI